jgi:hypothetical protein
MFITKKYKENSPICFNLTCHHLIFRDRGESFKESYLVDPTQEDLNKKAKEFNEFLLKQTAITFSLEGVSKDLKGLIQKKITHNRINLTQLSHMLQSLMCSDSKPIKEGTLKKGSPVLDLMNHIIKEIKVTDTMLNITISSLMNKEACLLAEKDLSAERSTNVQS